MVTPDARRSLAKFFQERWQYSQRRACALANLSRSVLNYKRLPDRNAKLREELKELASKHPRFGSPMLHMMLRNKGWQVNHKRIERLYREENLSLRRRKRKRYPVLRVVRPTPSTANECWSIDFIHDSVYGGRALRCFAAIDDATRECVALKVHYSLPGGSVVSILQQTVAQRGSPERIRLDNGPEFRSRTFIAWAQEQNIKLDFIEPGKPVQNAWIESFNSRFREECLNQEWFLGLKDAQQKIKRWRRFYNHERPHSALGGIPPSRFALRQQDDLLMTGT